MIPAISRGNRFQQIYGNNGYTRSRATNPNSLRGLRSQINQNMINTSPNINVQEEGRRSSLSEYGQSMQGLMSNQQQYQGLGTAYPDAPAYLPQEDWDSLTQKDWETQIFFNNQDSRTRYDLLDLYKRHPPKPPAYPAKRPGTIISYGPYSKYQDEPDFEEWSRAKATEQAKYQQLDAYNYYKNSGVTDERNPYYKYIRDDDQNYYKILE